MYILTLMVALPAPAEMEMLETASAVKVSIPASFRHEMNMCDYETTLFSAQCATNFQLVLGPVDSCFNCRVPYLPEYRSHRCISRTSKTGRLEKNY